LRALVEMFAFNQDKEYHDQISQIISVIGGNEVSLFGYIDNVLAHHLENYRDEIIRSFKKKTIFK
jgi:hypothetical protein